MGIFSNIRNSIYNVISYVKINWNLTNIFYPYFNKNESFHSLKKLEESIDIEITNIYNELKLSPKKYSYPISRYESFLPKVREHNNKVELIDKGIEGFYYQSYIDNPIKRNVEELNPYLLVVEQIEGYSYYEDKYKTFCTQVKDLKNNFEIIKEQFLLKDLYSESFTFNDDAYYDESFKKALINKLEPLLSSLAKVKKSYYDFSKLKKINQLIIEHNNKFVKKHLNDEIFDNIRGNSLDSQQREAILRDEVSNLTIAGAGSGKTLIICGKVKYLLEKKNIDPKDILLLSYSKKSADDLYRKLKEIDSKLTVATFHKLGLDILKETNNKVFDVEEQYNAIIESYFRDELKNKENMIKKVFYFFSYFSSYQKNLKKYSNLGDMFGDLKKSDLETLNFLKNLSLNTDKKETIKKELVKSYQELQIANFYFINGINYEYEKPYEKDLSTNDKKQYTPDFYLKDYNIYHEHYGIDRDGKAKQYEGKIAKDYVNTITWKRSVHQTYNTICIETYSYEVEDGTIFKKLSEELRKHKVKFNPLSPEEIYNALFSYYGEKNFKSFINLVKTFLNLYKSRYKTDEQFKKFEDYEFANFYEKQRTLLFLEIVKDVYSYYMERVRTNNRIDFDDMILKSSDQLSLTNKFSYKYIIVDEFQDISFSRMQFLKKLIEKGNSRLFAVGDDWQAIYRFSGCDLNIFLNFSYYFGTSETCFISSTHRNSQELQDIAGPFIKVNPEQCDKTIRSKKHLQNPVKVMYYTDNKYSSFLGILEDISKIKKDASVLILGRNNDDIRDLYTTNFYRDKTTKVENGDIVYSKDFPNLNLKYSTVHSSKGLEDEFVVIINAEDSRLGFPNKMEDDEVLNLVLSDKSSYPFAEERRLWYVALTRTKSYTYILCNQSRPSIFVDEIIDKCEILNPGSLDFEEEYITCPHCKTGKLEIKEEGLTKRKFYGCTNFPYCKYTINDFRAVKRNLRCPICGDFLVYRKNQYYKPFYGCHNYPKCKYKTEYRRFIN